MAESIGAHKMAEAVHGHGWSLGLAPCTAIVVGNIVGSWFYRAPTAMAPSGLLAILPGSLWAPAPSASAYPLARLVLLALVAGGPHGMADGNFTGFWFRGDAGSPSRPHR